MHTVHAQGAAIPALGFGTFELSPEQAQRMVRHALGCGYRHIDTAQVYGNEHAAGAGIRESGVPRDEIFVTTKIWVDRFRDGDLQASVDESLARLDTDYVDLLLLHWPNPEVPLTETMAALNAVRENGRARHIGVSNFTVALTREAVELSEAPLVTNQVEYHPFLDQRPVIDELEHQHMALTAYCPLARGKVFGNPTLERIGKAHEKTEGQVTLRWLLQHDDMVALPRSANERHAEQNLDVFDFELSETEMRAIDALRGPNGRLINPASLAPEWD